MGAAAIGVGSAGFASSRTRRGSAASGLSTEQVQRTKRRDEFLDFPLPFVVCRREHVLGEARRQMWRQADGRQLITAIPAARARRGLRGKRRAARLLNAVIGGPLGEASAGADNVKSDE